MTQEALSLVIDSLLDIIKGTRLDAVGNRDDDGLLTHNDSRRFKKRINAAHDAITAAKAIADLESQEPVAWPCHIIEADFSERKITLGMDCGDYKVSAGTHYLSTTPPQRTWVGLTDEERQEIWWSCEQQTPTTFVKAIQAKLKEKNT